MRLRVADVALFYAARGGGIRTYLDAKRAFAARTGAIDHHLVVPGRGERHEGGVHELPSVPVAASNGYRLPLGSRRLHETLRSIQPDVVLLHDPYWRPVATARAARELGALPIVVHHCSVGHVAAAAPGPAILWRGLVRALLARAYRGVGTVMAAADPSADVGVEAVLPLRLGLDPAFRPRPHVARQEHVLYVGRLSPEKGVFDLLEAAAGSAEPWPLRLVGAGPAESRLRRRARRLGLERRVSFHPFVRERAELARAYASASCVVVPSCFDTFGLVTLEAAASGARVVACGTSPAGRLVGPLAHLFAPGDPRSLANAIAAARQAAPDSAAAAAVAEAFGWERALAAEADDLLNLTTM